MKYENFEEILNGIKEVNERTFEIASRRKNLIPSMEIESLTPDAPHATIQALVRTYKLPVDVFNESDIQSRYYNLILRGRDELAERFYNACQGVFSNFSNVSRTRHGIKELCEALNEYDDAFDGLLAVYSEMGKPEKKSDHPYQTGIM